MLAELDKRTKMGVNPEPFLLQKSGQLFVNSSPLDIKRLMGTRTTSQTRPSAPSPSSRNAALP
ncbi:MAG TPA: hypothetical protein VKA84_10405 [Gemmatimonadaceae bacterium]|nr:hypothetical protein [Gemmatimonadaceae bacterium]